MYCVGHSDPLLDRRIAVREFPPDTLMPPTPYVLTVDDRPAYLYFHVRAGFIDVEMAARYINEMMSVLRGSAHKCVLFVREIKGVMTTNHIPIVTSVIANLLPPDILFALVDTSPAFDEIRQCIDREAEQKKRKLCVFRTEDEAEAWLLNSSAT